MSEGYRLRPLQVRISRHDGVTVLLRLVGQRRGESFKPSGYRIDLVSQIHAYIERDLVVAAAGGVKLLPRLADARGEHLFDEHVYILAGRIEAEFSRFDIRIYSFKSFADRRGFAVGDYPAPGEHLRVGDTAAYILPPHTAVEGYRRIEAVGRRVGRAVGAAGPHFIQFFSPFFAATCAATLMGSP